MVTIVKHGSSNALLQKILLKIKTQSPKKVLNAKKFCGVLKLQESPMQIQNRLRNEWQ